VHESRLLTAERAQRLLEAGVHAYNHNLNTSEANYAKICSTHTFADRVDTVGVARDAGLSPCSGAIFGMDESDEEIVDSLLIFESSTRTQFPSTSSSLSRARRWVVNGS